MPKLTLDGIIFNTEDLSERAWAELRSLQFLDEQMSKLDQEIKILGTAVVIYTDLLKSQLEGEG
jgi:hypothetical protein